MTAVRSSPLPSSSLSSALSLSSMLTASCDFVQNQKCLFVLKSSPPPVVPCCVCKARFVHVACDRGSLLDVNSSISNPTVSALCTICRLNPVLLVVSSVDFVHIQSFIHATIREALRITQSQREELINLMHSVTICSSIL